MDDTGKHLRDARKQLVEHRRAVVKSLAASSDREQLEAHINMMVRIQNAIDIIDRVSRDEDASHADNGNAHV